LLTSVNFHATGSVSSFPIRTHADLDLDPQHWGRILSVPLDGGETTLETDLQDEGSYEGVVRLLLEVKTPDILHKLEEERGTGGGSGTAEATPQKLLGVRERAELRHLKNKNIIIILSVEEPEP